MGAESEVGVSRLRSLAPGVTPASLANSNSVRGGEEGMYSTTGHTTVGSVVEYDCVFFMICLGCCGICYLI